MSRSLSLEILIALIIGGGLALIVIAWLNDPTSDAGCDDPSMDCSLNTQESP